MQDRPRPRVMVDVLDEHFEELDFLWDQRERIVFSSDWKLAELAALENRADAHLDGLLVGADDAVDLARPFLTGEDASAARTASFILMATADRGLESEVLRALSAATPAVRDGVRIGLRHCQVAPLLDDLTGLALGGDPFVRAAALDVLAFHRLPAPSKIDELLAISDPVVRGLVFDSVGRLGGPWSVDLLLDALDGKDCDLRRRALETSARLGMPELVSACRDSLKRAPLPEVLVFLGVLGHAQDLRALEEMSASRGLASAALTGLGAMGNVEAIPHLLSVMQEPLLAIPAGAAFMRITGALGIEAALPPPPSSVLGEDEPEFDASVVRLDPMRAERWWNENKIRFASGKRWQYGVDVGRVSFAVASSDLPLSARRDLYLALRARGFDQLPDVELEARARLQVEVLESRVSS